MKIKYISNSRIPTEKGYGIQITKMCEEFSNQNIDLELILPTRKNDNFKDTNIFEYYQIKNNFKLTFLKTPDPNWLMSLPNGIYIKFQILFFIFKLKQYLKKEKNILYTRDEYLLPILQKYSDQVVWEAHTLPNNISKYLSYWKKCKKIITISQGLKKELIQQGIDNNKILVAPDGVDLNKFNISESKEELRKKLNLPIDKKIIMYTGHLYDWKGVQTLADAAKQLSDQYITTFIGGTNHDIKNFKQKNKDNKNILILGHKSPNQIPQYLKAADVLVLPNSSKDKKARWTSPLKMFEYMASGKPIIASDLPSIREVLNKSNAVFFKPDDLQDLARKIKSDIDPQIAIQAKHDVQNYTWQKRTEKILQHLSRAK